MSLGGPTYWAAVKLRRMLSLSATFQAAVGFTGDAASTLQRIGFKQLAGTEPRPYGIISSGEKLQYKQIAGGNQIVLNSSGSLFLYLAQDIDPENFDDDVAAEMNAVSFFGQVIDEIAALSAVDDTGSADGTSHLSIVSITMSTFAGNAEDTWKSMGRFLFAGFDVEWDS